ncbi:MAG: hypothetical protein ABWU13_20445, partial [Limnospira maxima]
RRRGISPHLNQRQPRSRPRRTRNPLLIHPPYINFCNKKLRNVAKNFFGGGCLLFGVTSATLLDNGNIRNFIILSNISII